LQRVDDAADEGPTISASTATKCERCWHYRDDVGTDPAHPTICGRCASNLYGSGETRTVA
jgi:isoleucyl-tRNA synthetase